MEKKTLKQDDDIKIINNKILGEKIRNYRKRKKLSLEDLAKQMGISKLSIQKYEVGKRTIPFNILVDFFKILEIPLNELEDFFKKKEKSQVKKILKSLVSGNEAITPIVAFIDYLENLGYTFYITDNLISEMPYAYGKLGDMVRNPKVVIIVTPNKKNYFNIGIIDFLSFVSLYSENNESNLINYFEIYHLDRTDNGRSYEYDDIERMTELLDKYPLKTINEENVADKIKEILDKVDNLSEKKIIK